MPRSQSPRRSAEAQQVAARHLDVLARAPRPAGSDAEGAARAHCAATLRAAGFDVREEAFEYSALPGRWATSLGGFSSVGVLAAAGHVGYRGQGMAALVLLCVGAVVLAAAGLWLARRGVLDLPLGRARGVNLVATRGEPAVWLVAHLDSKSQPVPILVRAAGIVLSALVWVAALTLGVLQVAGSGTADLWIAVSGAGLVAGLPVAASVVGTSSPGALDDASGVAAVLLAASALPVDSRLGVLLTSAEELGLAGARAWVRGRAPAAAVNCDGVDDAGPVTAMYSGRRPARLLTAAERAAGVVGLHLAERRLLPGILVDGVAFADAGWEAITLSKGTARTLARIHTPRDRRDALEGEGVAEVASLMTELATRLETA